jgi:hypothetical protein
MSLQTGDEGRGSGGGDARSDNDGGETDNAAVDEPSSRVFVDEEFGGEFSHSIGTLWGGDGVGCYDFGLKIHNVQLPRL